MPLPNDTRIPNGRQFFRGERLLTGNCNEIFGAPPAECGGRILVTLGTEAGRPAHPAQFAESGADAARISPGVDLGLDPLTDRDRTDLDFIANGRLLLR